MNHCCPCEACKKSRKKSDRRTGRSHKVKGKDDDSPCEHCDTKTPHGVGQICRALREKVLLASDTNEGSKLMKDLKKENLKLSKKLAKGSKKLRSRSQPPSGCVADEEDEGSDEWSDLDSDDTDESRSSRGRRRKGEQNFVKRRHNSDFKTQLDEAQSGHENQQSSDDNPFRPLEDEKGSLQPSEHWYTDTEVKYSDTGETLTDDSEEPKPRRHKVKQSSQVYTLGEGPEVEVQIFFRVRAPKEMILIRRGKMSS